jgi:hypothetical protein
MTSSATASAYLHRVAAALTSVMFMLFTLLNLLENPCWAFKNLIGARATRSSYHLAYDKKQRLIEV